MFDMEYKHRNTIKSLASRILALEKTSNQQACTQMDKVWNPPPAPHKPLTLAVARSPQMQMSYAEFKDHAASLGYTNPEWTLANHGRQGDKFLEKVPPFIRIRPSLQEAARTVLSTATDFFRVN
jgi:hypothetical protein